MSRAASAGGEMRVRRDHQIDRIARHQADQRIDDERHDRETAIICSRRTQDETGHRAALCSARRQFSIHRSRARHARSASRLRAISAARTHRRGNRAAAPAVARHRASGAGATCRSASVVIELDLDRIHQRVDLGIAVSRRNSRRSSHSRRSGSASNCSSARGTFSGAPIQANIAMSNWRCLVVSPNSTRAGWFFRSHVDADLRAIALAAPARSSRACGCPRWWRARAPAARRRLRRIPSAPVLPARAHRAARAPWRDRRGNAARRAR